MKGSSDMTKLEDDKRRLLEARRRYINDPQFQPDPITVEYVSELVVENDRLTKKLKGADRYNLAVTILVGILCGVIILLVAS